METKYMMYTEALKMLSEVMKGRPDIKEVKFNWDDGNFDVITDNVDHVCFLSEFE